MEVEFNTCLVFGFYVSSMSLPAPLVMYYMYWIHLYTWSRPVRTSEHGYLLSFRYWVSLQVDYGPGGSHATQGPKRKAQPHGRRKAVRRRLWAHWHLGKDGAKQPYTARHGQVLCKAGHGRTWLLRK